MVDVLSGIGLGVPMDHQYTCSRAGCREAAKWALVWRNPKIHGQDRRKTWLACEEHLDVLRAFLSDRSFPLETKPVGEIDE
ncbi:MAG: hypothetical protein ACTIJ6_04120 [Leucobacter sp.]